MAEAKTEEYDGKLIHVSVGALIQRDVEILLIDRANFPPGLVGPAGHVDQGETQSDALKREVHEETGLTIVDQKLLLEEFVPWNKCSRGVEGHYWYLYRVEVSGEIKTDTREAKSIGWYPKTVLNLEPVWEYWFDKLTEMDEL